MNKKNIFERLTSGEVIPMDDPDYVAIREMVNRTKKLSNQLNSLDDLDDIRSILGEIIGKKVDDSTTLFTPFYTNIAINISLGKNVFINHACSFLDLGGIEIKDDLMIGPRVNITSENHPTEIATRKSMVPSKVIIEENVWIGAGATILPGVRVGRNSVVADCALVNKDVPPQYGCGGHTRKNFKKIGLAL